MIIFDVNAYRQLNKDAYILYGTAGFDAVTEGHPLVIVGIFSRGENILETLVVWSLIDHPNTTLHPNGAAVSEVALQVSTVTATVVAATLEFLLLEKCDLCKGKRKNVRTLDSEILDEQLYLKHTLAVIFYLTFPIWMHSKPHSLLQSHQSIYR